MITNSKIIHPLQHKGTSQLERLLSVLKPESLKIDAHALQDIIAATNGYAKLLAFHNEQHQIDGDWTCFWEVEPLTFLAIVGSIDTDKLLLDYQARQTTFNALLTSEQDEGAVNQYALDQIEFIKSLAQKIEHFYRLLPEGLPLKKEIFSLIKRNNLTDTEQLASALHALIGYHKEAYPRTLSTPADLNHSHYDVFFSDQWEILDPPAFYQIPFSTAYLLDGFEKLDDLVKVFHQALVKIKTRANFWFEHNISQPEVKQPHVALFLAFLHLFEYAREDLNNLTKEHLEYYYKRILHLREASEIPDEVHLIFELANNVDQYLVTSGTELLAGKDKDSKPLIFKTVEDWVVNKAKVESLKNSYLSLMLGKLFTNPEVTKNYCQQQALPNEKAKDWRAMGDDYDLPFGDYGFAIASPQLILEEGHRRLSTILRFETGFPFLHANQLNLYLSSEEEWVKPPPYSGTQLNSKNPTSTGFKLELYEVEMKIGPFEIARRLAADAVSDMSQYVGESTKANAEVSELFERTGQGFSLLNEYILNVGYEAIHILNQAINAGSRHGEYYFLRAYFYWSLAKTFAPPVNIAIDASGDSNKTMTKLLRYIEEEDLKDRREFALLELWGLIKSDLILAKRLLENGTDNKINTYVAAAFLARVHFQLGEYEQVIAESQYLLDNGPYSFNTTTEVGVYEFTEDFNKEAVWWYDIENENYEDLIALINWKNKEGDISNTRVLPVSHAFLRTVNWMDDDGLLNKKVAEADHRFLAYFKAVDQGDDPIFEFNSLQLWCNKYHQRDAQQNKRITILKTPEVAFNLVYALFKMGDTSAAIETFNLYRTSRGLKPVTSLNEQVILNERSIEMAFEGDRRDYLQSLELDIPADDMRESIPWDSESLYASPNHFRNISVGEQINLSFRKMKLQAILLEDFPPIVPFKNPPNEHTIRSPWPILKLTFNQLEYFAPGIMSQSLESTLNKIELNVAVKGIRENLVIHSDVGVFDGKQEFLPFAASPKRGKLFRLGSAEAMRKKLDLLNLKFTWIDPPDFTYSTYTTNYVDQAGNTITENNFPFPDLKIDFQNNATQAPQFGGNVGTTNIINNLLFEDTLDTISGIITTNSGDPLANVLVIPIFSSGGVPAFAASPTLEVGQVSNQLGQFEIPVDNNIVGLRFEAINPDEKQPNNVEYYAERVTIVGETSENVNVEVILTPYFIFEMIDQGDLVSEYEIASPNINRYGRALDFDEYNPTLPQGFAQFELVNGDFMHRLYPHSLTFQAIAAGSGGTAELPLPPYTPATNGISLNYKSNQTIEIGKGNDGIDQFYHVLPNGGYKEIPLLSEISTNIPLIYPYLAHDNGDAVFTAGNLYIGLADLQPGSNLSLLIQMKEGSEAEPDWQAPSIHWSFLSENNDWIPFSAAQILTDTSFGLTRTGLVQLEVPSTAVNSTTLFEEQLYWLRVAVIEDYNQEPPRSAKALPRIINVQSQALLARFDNRENDLAHLSGPLPANRVTKLIESRSTVKKIDQPFPSFGGRMPEKGNSFYQRVSERLRHKERAVTIWDYERLVLQNYPKVYKVKCLSHSHLTSALAPGHVLIVVIPDLQQRQDDFPITPRFSKGDLNEIESFLRQKTNLFTGYTHTDGLGNVEDQYLWVANPIYEPIKLKFDVRFRQGHDINFHKFLLDNDLRNFLAPWLKDKQLEISFDRNISRSAIVQFIEDRPYVDVVLNMEILHCQMLVPAWQQIIAPTTSRSILTAHIKSGKNPEQTDHEIRTFSHTDPIPC